MSPGLGVRSGGESKRDTFRPVIRCAVVWRSGRRHVDVGG
jgi:hypothetical protein